MALKKVLLMFVRFAVQPCRQSLAGDQLTMALRQSLARDELAMVLRQSLARDEVVMVLMTILYHG
eukprot:15359950-Ditylum_brightwellii.AAC.1